jgi:hypothetical protein
MKIACLVVCALIGLSAHAQQANQDSIRKRRVEYYFQIQSGALIGCNSCSKGKEITFSGSTTHGIKIGRKLRVGTGIGLDSYFEWNTIPVFGSVSWDLIGKKNTLFVEMNYGGALAAWRQTDYEEYGYQNSNGGKVYGYSLGYRVKYEKIRMSFGIGHKTQVLTSYYEYPTFYWDNNNYLAGEPSYRTVKNEMNRLTFWIAVGWK